MLVAVILLNKTSGRAANPVREEIFTRWSHPQALAGANQQELAEVLYPLGLFNQRANSLIKLSQQYIQFAWPLTPLPHSPTFGIEEDSVPKNLDVRTFYGAGVYASDSFRIYSPLFPGRGGPEKEDKCLGKRERAYNRQRGGQSIEGQSSSRPVDTVEGPGRIPDLLLSDEEEDESEGEEDEWRKVRPTGTSVHIPS